MALLKLAEIITGLNGKIGGQTISQTRNGTVIKNIGQPPKQGSTLQMQQRSETAYITNKWQKLSVSARQSFIDTAHNYTWTNSIGEIVTRNGFQVFCFLNQNLNTLDLGLITTAPIYEAVPIPVLENLSTDNTHFLIKASNTSANCKYVVFGMIHYSKGASSIENTPVKIAELTNIQIGSTFDILPYFKDYFAYNYRGFRAVIEVFAIDFNTGNKTLVSQRLEQNINSTVKPEGLISYYNFNGNLDDYYNINNGVNYGATFTNNGIINNAVTFDRSLQQFFILPNSESLQFYNELGPLPFTFYFWTELFDNNLICWFSKRDNTGSTGKAQFQLTTEPNYIQWIVFGSNLSLQSRIKFDTVLNTNQLYNIAVTYDGAETVQFYLDGVLSGTFTVSLGFGQMTDGSKPIYFGRSGWKASRYVNGTISELGIFNGVLSQSQINQLISGNLNGLTIPQII